MNIDQKYTWRHDVGQEMGHEESVKPRKLSRYNSSERKEMPTGVLWSVNSRRQNEHRMIVSSQLHHNDHYHADVANLFSCIHIS